MRSAQSRQRPSVQGEYNRNGYEIWCAGRVVYSAGSLHVWSVVDGLVDTKKHTTTAANDPLEALVAIKDMSEKTIILLRDFHLFLQDPNPILIRQLKDVLQEAKTKSKTLIILGCRLCLPPELEHELTVIEFALPGKEELRAVLGGIMESAGIKSMENEAREKVIDAASGLTTIEAENAFALSVTAADNEILGSDLLWCRHDGEIKPFGLRGKVEILGKRFERQGHCRRGQGALLWGVRRLWQFTKLSGPALVWMSMIFAASSDSGSFQHTSRIIVPLVRWLFPHLSDDAIHAIVVTVRKGAHLSEYAGLAALLWRALRSIRQPDTVGWSWPRAGFFQVLAIFHCRRSVKGQPPSSSGLWSCQRPYPQKPQDPIEMPVFSASVGVSTAGSGGYGASWGILARLPGIPPQINRPRPRQSNFLAGTVIGWLDFIGV